MRTNPRNEILALDPSIRSAGVALYRCRKLVGAATLRISPTKDNVATRCLRMAQEVVGWVVEREAAPATLVVEWPKISGQTLGKDPNDQIGLAGVVGAVSSQLAMLLVSSVAGMLSSGLAMQDETLSIVSYTPGEWSGGMSKVRKKKGAEGSVRAQYTRRRLLAEELVHWPTNEHDALDAVGIGLKFLGRFEPRTVFVDGDGKRIQAKEVVR